MNQSEKQLKKLQQDIHSVDFEQAEARIEMRLRSAWKEEARTRNESFTQEYLDMNNSKESNNSTTPLKEKRKRLPLALGTLAIFALAFVSTNYVNSMMTASTGSSLGVMEMDIATKSSGLHTDSDMAIQGYGSAEPSNSLFANVVDSVAEMRTEREESTEMVIEPIIPAPDDYYYEEDPTVYSYSDDDEEKQLFDESVSFAIRVEQDTNETINRIRDEVTALEGFIVSAYDYDSYNTGGDMFVRIPTEKLSTFEAILRDLDRKNELDVSEYDITNVSEEVVTLDEKKAVYEKDLKDIQDAYKAGSISEEEYNAAKKQGEELILEVEKKRQETIAQYQYTSVYIQIIEWQPFWEGNSIQYDRDTFSGRILSKLSRTWYDISYSVADVLVFLIWLAFYAVILFPVWIVGKKVYRKVKPAIDARKKKNNTTKK